MPTPDDPQKQDDAKFLVEQFDLPAEKAARLLTRNDADKNRLAAATRAAERQGDTLADAPVPAEPAHDLVPDTDEQRLKPVLHQPNDRAGGG